MLVDTIKAWPALLLTPWLDKSEPLASLPQVSLGPASSDPTALGIDKKSHISRDVNHASYLGSKLRVSLSFLPAHLTCVTIYVS